MTGDAVRAKLKESDPTVNERRYFCDYPLVDKASGHTYVLSNQWGRITQQKLEALAEAFPEAKVMFRRTEALDE